MEIKFTFTQLLKFRARVDYDLFKAHFRDFSIHLWRKFSGDYKHDLLGFYSSLDTENRVILERMISENF